MEAVALTDLRSELSLFKAIAGGLVAPRLPTSFIAPVRVFRA